MTPSSQRAYLSLSAVFLAIGLAGAAAGVLDAALALGWFRGNPALTALALLGIGGALRWTALRAELSKERPGVAAGSGEASPSEGTEEDEREGDPEDDREPSRR